MRTKFTVKRLVLGCLVFAIGLMTLLTLCIPILKAEYLELSECGFSFFDFEADSLPVDDEVVVISGIFFILQLLLSICTMLFGILTVFFFEDKTTKKIRNGFSIPCVVLMFLYMLFGIILINTEYECLSIGGYYIRLCQIEYAAYPYFELYTLSYFGFIFGALLFAGYIVCRCVLPSGEWKRKEKPTGQKEELRQEIQSTQIGATQNAVIDSARSIAESLKTYKELLDSGIITQEEFDEKKKQIMG